MFVLILKLIVNPFKILLKAFKQKVFQKFFCADWHYHFYFKDKKPLKIYPYDKENPLQMQGIYKRKSPFLDKEYFVANYARAKDKQNA